MRAASRFWRFSSSCWLLADALSPVLTTKRPGNPGPNPPSLPMFSAPHTPNASSAELVAVPVGILAVAGVAGVVGLIVVLVAVVLVVIVIVEVLVLLGRGPPVLDLRRTRGPASNPGTGAFFVPQTFSAFRQLSTASSPPIGQSCVRTP